MADTAVQTIQKNLKQASTSMTSYSLFLGGLNAKNAALEQYNPLKTGYARLFIMSMPRFMDKVLPEGTKTFKHLLEYGNVRIDGLQNTTLEFEQMTGGYSGRQLDVATVSKDETNEITVSLYEFAGSPVRNYIDTWIRGISDPHTGIGHYHGQITSTFTYSQHNHTMEAIYVQTDPTGRADAIEYACMFTNMIPKQVKIDHFNYEAGQHQIVQTDIPFTVVKYESAQINLIATKLVERFSLLRNSLDFNSGYTEANVTALAKPDLKDITS